MKTLKELIKQYGVMVDGYDLKSYQFDDHMVKLIWRDNDGNVCEFWADAETDPQLVHGCCVIPTSEDQDLDSIEAGEPTELFFFTRTPATN